MTASLTKDATECLQLFPMQLRALIADSQLSQRLFAEKCEISEASVCRYLRGQRLPSMFEIIKIAQVCEVSADYLLGLVDSCELEK